jgi:hypothetical protein
MAARRGGVRTSAPIPGVVLAVDVAVSSDWIALAVAGPADPGAPRPFTVFSGSSAGRSEDPTFSGIGRTGGVALVSKSALSVAPSDGSAASTFGCALTNRIAAPVNGAGIVGQAEQVTSVAFTPSGNLVYLTRDPSTLNIVQSFDVGNSGAGATRIELGGEGSPYKHPSLSTTTGHVHGSTARRRQLVTAGSLAENKQQ